MATELIRKVWCDMHLSRDDKRVPADDKPVRIVIDGRSREADLCGECRSPVEQVYLAGREPESSSYRLGAPSNVADTQCPVCGSVLRKTSLSGHTRNVHGVTMSELNNGGKARASAQNPGAFPCDRCEFVALAPQGLGAHRRAAHHIVGRDGVPLSEDEQQTAVAVAAAAS